MATAKTKRETTATAPGVIEPQALYTAEEARRRLRLGEWAWRSMRRDGLPVLRVAGRAYITGRELIYYIERKGREAETD